MTDPMELFTGLIAVVHDGRRPYRWQQRLFDDVLTRGRWPDRIDAPTGAGKTAVIDVHVALNALAGLGEEVGLSEKETGRLQMLPRRLALVVPRRALVDSQFDESTRLAEAITAAGEDPIVRLVRRGLVLRAGATTDSTPLVVDAMRGGMVGRRGPGFTGEGWRLHPERCALLHLTPDMFGSALLFRRYGGSRGSRPIDAGLLGHDTVAVLDEGHLQQQLLRTARRVGALAQDGEPLGRPVLQVVATTATPGDADAPAAHTIGLDPADLDADAALARRMRASKPLRIQSLDRRVGDRRSIEQVVDLLIELHEETGGTVGCVVNTVAAATRIARRLREVRRDADPESVQLLVGRMRPHDRQRLMAQHPGLLTEVGDPTVAFLVATQTIEVGVDLDLAGLVTELAPASALAQRAGRVNRRGLRASGPVVVLDPPARGRAGGPYEPEELDRAREWLARIGEEISPATVASVPPPPPALRRTLLSRVERWDAEYWASTSERLAAETAPVVEGSAPDRAAHHADDLSLWIQDGVESSLEVSVAVLRLPRDDVMARQLLELLPPYDEELLPSPIGIARATLEAGLGRATGIGRVLLLAHDDDGVHAEVVRPAADGAAHLELAPGMTVVLDEDAEVFLSGVLDPEGRERLDDIHATVAVERDEPCVLCAAAVDTAGLDELPGRPIAWRRAQRMLAALADPEPEESVVELGRELLEPGDGIDVMTPLTVDVLTSGSDAHGDPTRALVVIRPERASIRAELWQTSSVTKRVPLAVHQQAVADLARELAERVGLPAPLVSALEEAGRLHDEGKRDRRFQTLLRNGRPPRPDDEPLAKSGLRSVGRQRTLRARLGVAGWRHEQLSAAIAWRALDGRDRAERDLVTRLVGTSHGHGRAAFEQSGAELIPTAVDGSSARLEAIGGEPVAAAAHELFDRGGWEELVQRTDRRHGVWGIACLEALLRAADMTVSAKGS
jgi:CRISPR-associated endonuclease/helicase Cas3